MKNFDRPELKPVSEYPVELEHLPERLRQLRDEDQEIIQNGQEQLKLLGNTTSEEAQQVLRDGNAALKKQTDELKLIVDKFGWPSAHLVGEEASRSAWLIVQHADFDVDFQRRCLALMEANESPALHERQNTVFLRDRVLLGAGKKQIYGTQGAKDYETGKWALRPLEDYENADRLREELGMEPLAIYINKHNES